MGDGSISKKKDDKVDKNKVTIRKTAGIISMIVGIPNFIAAILVTLGGLAATIFLGIMIYQLLTGDSGDDPLGALCVVFILILAIVGFILAIILTILSVIFAFAVGGQTLGGWYAFRGRRYGRAVVLTIIGSIVSLLAGLGMLVAGLSMKDAALGVKIGALVWGGYNIFAFLVTMTSMVLYVKSKETFVKPEKKKKKKKKGKNGTK